ncbi:hypothetical protein A1O3_08884, partial [Capronia epimyces CBS 606.96]
MKEKLSITGGKHGHSIANMDSLMPCFHPGNLPPQRSQPPVSPTYSYIPGQYWQTLDYYNMTVGICSGMMTETTEVPQTFMSNSHHNSLVNFEDSITMVGSPMESLPLDAISNPDTELLQHMQTDSSIQESPATEMENSAHSPRSHRHHHSCMSCDREKRERRKEQNRKAQRNHRLRSEEKLEQLRSKAQLQTEEIASLKEANRSLRKHIEMLTTSRDKNGGTTGSG